MYADTVSEAMSIAINETNRRRTIQNEYNERHGIIPKTIIKEIREVITNNDNKDITSRKSKRENSKKTIEALEREMKEAAKMLDFERAMEIRDAVFELKADM